MKKAAQWTALVKAWSGGHSGGMSPGATIFGTIVATIVCVGLVYGLNKVADAVPLPVFVLICAIIVACFYLLARRWDKQDEARRETERSGPASTAWQHRFDLDLKSRRIRPDRHRRDE